MGDKSGIQWTDATWNPLTGCTRVPNPGGGPSGCDNCYAAAQAAGRLKNTSAYEGLAVITPSGRAAFNGKIRLLPDRLNQPLRWRKPRRIFVDSMSDLFHPDVPDEFIDRVWTVMALATQHVFQVLTKRPQRMVEYLTALSEEPDRLNDQAAQFMSWEDVPLVAWPLPNVRLGTSVENQAAAEERIPHLLRVPAAVRFLSCEPLLGPIDLQCWDDTGCPTGWIDGDPGVDWVIVGGESGPKARPCDVAWIRSIQDQCHGAGVPCFVKQMGSRSIGWHIYPASGHMERNTPMRWQRNHKGGDPAEWPEDLRVREWPAAAAP